jgi:hypothetical protein
MDSWWATVSVTLAQPPRCRRLAQCAVPLPCERVCDALSSRLTHYARTARAIYGLLFITCTRTDDFKRRSEGGGVGRGSRQV